MRVRRVHRLPLRMIKSWAVHRAVFEVHGPPVLPLPDHEPPRSHSVERGPMRRILPFTILAVVLIAAARSHAGGLTGAGLQIGWSTSPDDFLVGFHYNARPMGEELDLVPSLDFGFGDVTMIAPNLDAHYVLKTSSSSGPISVPA